MEILKKSVVVALLVGIQFVSAQDQKTYRMLLAKVMF